MLNHEIGDIFLIDVFALQVLSAVELIAQAKCIHNGSNAIQTSNTVLNHGWIHGGNTAKRLCDRSRLTNTAGLNHDVVEFLQARNVVNLFHQVRLQRAADATILKSHKAVVLLAHDATFLNEAGIDVYFTDIVYYYGKFDAVAVRQNAVDECGFSAAQVAC